MQNLLKLHLILFSILVFIFGCNSSDLSKKEGKVSKENIDYSVSEGDYINVKSSNTDNTNTYTKNILIPLEKKFRNKCLHVYSESVVTLKISSDISARYHKWHLKPVSYPRYVKGSLNL